MLNDAAAAIVGRLVQELDSSAAGSLRIAVVQDPTAARVLDFGCHAHGSLQAGIELTRICLAGQGQVELQSGRLGEHVWPHLTVHTDRPLQACLFSQYAGWQLADDSYFGMGSGPMRAAGSREELFERLDYREQPSHAVGVIESGQLPTLSIQQRIAEHCRLPLSELTLCVAPTASPAGNVQIVARSVETALHKLHELGFDVRRIESGWGTAPLPPVAGTDLEGIGRTNDAILYGGTVHLWVRGDDESLEEIGPRVPSGSSPDFGRSFLELFEAAGRDFYKLDPHLFSPACVVLHNLDTGRVHPFGQLMPEIVCRSFGLPA